MRVFTVATGIDEDFGDLGHRFAVVIGKVDHRALLFRQGVDHAAQRTRLVVLHDGDFRRVGGVGHRRRVGVVDPFFLALAQMRQRLEAGDAEQPGRDLRTALEAGRLLPELQKNLIRDIVCHRFRSRLARHEPVDPGVVAHEQEPHGSAIALCDASDQFKVGLLAWRGGHGWRAAPRPLSRPGSKRFTGNTLYFGPVGLTHEGAAFQPRIP